MTSKTTTAKFTFRIEPKPGGGFLARSDDPTAETMEGESREEVQEKIEEKLTAMVGDQILKPLKIAGVNVKVNISTHRPLAPSVQPVWKENLSSSGGVRTPTATQFDSSGRALRWIAVLLAFALLIVVLARK